MLRCRWARLAALAPLAVLLLSLPAPAGEIHRAIVAGDTKGVAKLLARDPALASAPDDNDTRDLPLHTAAVHGRLDIARLLLDAGAAVDGSDVDESTPLHVAALRRQGEMVEFLLERGADVNRRDRNGACSLSFAAFSGDGAIVERLIEAGADLNFRDSRGITLLHAACLRGLPDLFDLLIERGHGVEEASSNGSTPLHWAAAGGQKEMAERLLELGASATQPDTLGRTPVFKAVQSGNAELVTLLLERGADPNVANSEGLSCLLPAVWGGEASVITALLEHGADPNIVHVGRTPLWWATQRGSAEVIPALLAAGADPDAVDPESGRTPLHNATIAGHADVVSLLVEAGVSVDVEDKNGHTAARYAVRHGHDAIAKRLASAGARPVETDEILSLATPGGLDEREALVWYLGHSGWAVQTRNHFLIFDYTTRDRPADEPRLRNGHVRTAELSGLDVAVFASHAHGDHFDPAVFDWRKDIDRITYVLGLRPEEAEGFEGEFPPHEYVGPHDVREIDGMTVRTIESNDSGVGFVVEADGVVIFHPGDHANRVTGTLEGYREEIDRLAAANVRPDICFQPISGCGFGAPEVVKEGVEYTLETLRPHLFVPMHSGNMEHRYRTFVDECRERFPEVRMHAAEARGDCVPYVEEAAS